MVSFVQQELVQGVLRKVEELLTVPRSHFEHAQLLRYTTGQEFPPHHDYNIRDEPYPGGARILTVFFYFNDVDEGGETEFPTLKLSK